MTKNRLIYPYAFLVLLCIIGAIINSEIIHIISFILFLGIIFSNIVKRDYRAIIATSIMIIPCYKIFLFNSMPLYNIIFALSMIGLLIAKKKINIPKKAILVYGLIIIIDFMKFIFFIGKEELTIINILTAFSLYTTIFYSVEVFFTIKDSKGDKKIAITAFVLGTTCSIIYGYLYRYINYGLSNTFISSSAALRNSGASLDPNYFSYFIIMSISFLFIKYFNDKKNNKYLIAIIILLFCGLSSISRMFFILCIPVIITLIILIIKSLFSSNFIKTTLVLAALAVIIIPFIPIFSRGMEVLWQRFTPDSSIDISNGRINLVETYNEIARDNPLIGLIGVGIPKYHKRLGVPLYAHNLYAELYICGGIVGIIAIFLFASIVVTANRNKQYIRYLPILLTAITGLAISFVDVEGLYIILAIICALTNKENKQNGDMNHG